ncbi:MAG: type VI secretion system contractile sheath large subunit [Phycisphaerales bacterium]|nr:MAG: type VI secretion system contractile sheath large subunit [Phycisphaerales bacterium]
MTVPRMQTEGATPVRLSDDQPHQGNGLDSSGTVDGTLARESDRATTEHRKFDEHERAASATNDERAVDHRVPPLVHEIENVSIEDSGDLAKVVLDWLGPDTVRSFVSDPGAFSLFLSRLLAMFDRQLRDQVNEIIHHPDVQALESSWRGLRYLVEQVNRDERRRIQVRVLNLSWDDLRRDMQLANEFDQSELFRKVYEEEYGMPGGEPYGLLIGDYQIERTNDDLEVLEHIGGVAQAAFVPFIAGAAPSLIGLDRFDELYRMRSIGDLAPDAVTATWRGLRHHEHARFIGLALPRILLRRLYRDDGSREDGFRFWEDAGGVSDYLWGNAAWGFGAVVLRAFDRTNWLADIRGVQRGREVGGLVPALEPEAFQTDRAEPAVFKPLTEVILTDQQEKTLADLGFLPTVHLRESGRVAFYNTHSLHQPKQYTDESASASDRLASMLHYTLCASRFAHYLKVMMCDRIGRHEEPELLQDELNRWLSKYVRQDDDATPDMRARFPLREGRIRIWETQPGRFASEIHLQPHYQLDSLAASVRFLTREADGLPS